MITKWDICSRVGSRVKDCPLGSPVLVEFVEDAAQDIEMWTGNSVNLTNIGSNYQNIMTNLGALYTLGYMNGVGVSYNIGRISVDKRSELEGQARHMEFLAGRVNTALNMLGRRISSDKTDPTT